MDNETLKEVIHNYGDSILRMAYSYLHNIDDAQDILQETLLKYIEKHPHFESDQHQKAWLLRVSCNLAKNFLRDNKVNKRDDLSIDTFSSNTEEDLSYIWSIVKCLPSKYSEVIHLYYYEEYNVKEISQILHRNEITIRSQLKRAKDKLKVLLEKED